MSMPSVYHISIKGSKMVRQCVSTQVQFMVDIEVGHPQFKILKTRMESLAATGDAEAFRCAAADFQRLEDEMVQGAIDRFRVLTNKQLGWLGSATGVLILLSVLFAAAQPFLHFVSMPVAMVCCFYAYHLSRRLADAEAFVRHLSETSMQRLDDTCVSAGFGEKEGNG